MIAVLLLGMLACAGAAPHHHYDRLFDSQFESSFNNFLTDDFFDTQRFWEDMRSEMEDLHKRIADLTKVFSSASPTQGIEGDEFVVRMKLTGYTAKDIRVQAKDGILMIQAVHDKGSNKNSFLTVRTLPDYVKPDGNWTFTDDVLKISLPIKRNDAAPAPASTVSPVDDREELDANGADIDVRNADVGFEAGAKGVEATTYAVNLKDEVEFVPMQYK